MQAVRNAVVFVLAIGVAFLVLSPKQRSAAVEKLAEVRRFVSRRIADREARASRLASETWDNEGGAIPAAGAPPQ